VYESTKKPNVFFLHGSRTLINCLDSSLEGVDTAGGFVLL